MLTKNFQFFQRVWSSWRVAFLLALVVLTNSSELLDHGLLPRMMVLLAVSMVYLVSELRTSRFRGRSEIHITYQSSLFLLFVAVSLLSGVSSDLLVEYAFAGLRLMLYLMLYLYLLRILKRDFDHSVFKVMLCLNIVLCAIGLKQFFDAQMVLSTESVQRITALMGHKNLFSEFLAITLPYVAISVLQLKGFWRPLAAFSTITSLLFITILLGRAAWVALVVIVLMGLLLLLLIRPKEVGRWQRKFWLVGILILTFSMFPISLLIDHWTGGMISERLGSMLRFQEGSAHLRIQVWQLAWKTLCESPVLGIGLGNLQIELGKHQIIHSQDKFLTKAHNDFAGVAMESGVVALISYVGMLIYSLVKLFRMVAEPASSNIHTAALLSLVGFIVVSFFSFPFQRVEHTSMMILAMAIAGMNDSGVSVRLPALVLSMGRGMLLLFVAVGAWFGIERYSSEMYTKAALFAKQRQNWNKVIREIDDVNRIAYPIEPSATPVIWYRGVAYFQLQQIAKAKDDFLEAYAVNPNHMHVLNNLATCYALQGDMETGIAFYHKAIGVNNRFTDAYKNLMEVYWYLHRYDDAIRLIDDSPIPMQSRFKKERKLTLEKKYNFEQTIK